MNLHTIRHCSISPGQTDCPGYRLLTYSASHHFQNWTYHCCNKNYHDYYHHLWNYFILFIVHEIFCRDTVVFVIQFVFFIIWTEKKILILYRILITTILANPTFAASPAENLLILTTSGMAHTLPLVFVIFTTND